MLLRTPRVLLHGTRKARPTEKRRHQTDARNQPRGRNHDACPTNLILLVKPCQMKRDNTGMRIAAGVLLISRIMPSQIPNVGLGELAGRNDRVLPLISLDSSDNIKDAVPFAVRREVFRFIDHLVVNTNNAVAYFD